MYSKRDVFHVKFSICIFSFQNSTHFTKMHNTFERIESDFEATFS